MYFRIVSRSVCVLCRVCLFIISLFNCNAVYYLRHGLISTIKKMTVKTQKDDSPCFAEKQPASILFWGFVLRDDGSEGRVVRLNYLCQACSITNAPSTTGHVLLGCWTVPLCQKAPLDLCRFLVLGLLIDGSICFVINNIVTMRCCGAVCSIAMSMQICFKMSLKCDVPSYECLIFSLSNSD